MTYMYDYLNTTFMITYIFMIITFIITGYQGFFTKNDPEVRRILWLESAISLIAGIFYSIFIAWIDNEQQKSIEIDWKEINKLRYIEWAITTPLMLLSFCLILGMNAKIPFRLSIFLIILLLDYAMLYIGLLGELGIITMTQGFIMWFIFFIILFSLIYFIYIYPTKTTNHFYWFYWFYFIVWDKYGFIYLLDNKQKNFYTNILDLIAKPLNRPERKMRQTFE